MHLPSLNIICLSRRQLHPLLTPVTKRTVGFDGTTFRFILKILFSLVFCSFDATGTDATGIPNTPGGSVLVVGL